MLYKTKVLGQARILGHDKEYNVKGEIESLHTPVDGFAFNISDNKLMYLKGIIITPIELDKYDYYLIPNDLKFIFVDTIYEYLKSVLNFQFEEI